MGKLLKFMKENFSVNAIIENILEGIKILSDDFTNHYKTLTYTTTDLVTVSLNGDYTDWAATGKIVIPTGATKIEGKHAFYYNENQPLYLPSFIFFDKDDNIIGFVVPDKTGADMYGSGTYCKVDTTYIPLNAVSVVVQAYTNNWSDQDVRFK